MTASPRLGFTYLTEGQDVPETSVNEIAAYLESGSGHFIFKDRDLATPPGSPANGDCYLVAAAATGAWTGHTGDIAYYLNTAWIFIEVVEGYTAWVNDEDVFIGYDGAAWNDLAGGGGGGSSAFEATATVPVASAFANVISGPTFSDSSIGMTYTTPTPGGTQFYMARYTGSFSSNFTMTIRARPTSFVNASAYNCCLVLRNSTNGRYVIFGDYQASTQMLVQNWTNDTTFSANVLGPTTIPVPMIPWKRIVVSGGNISFEISANGQDWHAVTTSTVAGFLTASGGGSLDQIGVGGLSVSSAAGSAIFQSFTVA